jgi:hypothetical protein
MRGFSASAYPAAVSLLRPTAWRRCWNGRPAPFSGHARINGRRAHAPTGRGEPRGRSGGKAEDEPRVWLLARRVMALAPEGSLVTHFLAVLTAVFPPVAALGHHAFARRMCTFLSVGHGTPTPNFTRFFMASVSRSSTLRIERSRMTRLSLSRSMHVLLAGTRVADGIRIEPFWCGLSPASFADPERRGPRLSSAPNQRGQCR